MPPILNKRWTIQDPPPPEIADALAEYPEIFRAVLFHRGVTDGEAARRFLEAPLPDLNPSLLKDMPAAVERILYAVDCQEKIAIYGDYDVDGVTANALLFEVLQAYGADVVRYIPDRFNEGYGLNNEAISLLAQQGVELIITVDCGIRSPDEADHAAALGLDLIITDHHHPGSRLPNACAVIDPLQPGDPYPESGKSLSGVGLAFKLAQALLLRRPLPGRRAEDWLDLVALGTIADVVPLTGENRALVRAGLQRLRASRRQGVVSLAGAAGLHLANLSAGDVGFMLAPRLNAAGRLESAMYALDLLLERDPQIAGDLAIKLDQQNRDRQDLTREMHVQAVEIASQAESDHILFAFDPTFNSGIVGLVATRLVESYYRPAVVGQIEAETARASCRSIPEFHITHALDQCQDLLVRHGGHSLAAGFTVRLEHLDELRRRLTEIAGRELQDRDLVPELMADGEIDLKNFPPDQVSRLLRYLDLLQPTGQGNPEASFITRGLRVIRAMGVGSDKKHLKLTVAAGPVVWDAIAFRMGDWIGRLPLYVDLLYRFERNEFNGRVTIQLNVRDLQPSRTFS